MSEYDSEPVLGLPEILPAGEFIVWQGQPDAFGLARRALLAPYVAGYFGSLAAWSGAAALSQGAGAAAAIVSAGWLVLMGLAAIAILFGVAWAMQRSTIYTITNRRIVMGYGVALSMAVNIPFNEIQAAGLRTCRHDGRHHPADRAARRPCLSVPLAPCPAVEIFACRTDAAGSPGCGIGFGQARPRVGCDVGIGGRRAQRNLSTECGLACRPAR